MTAKCDSISSTSIERVWVPIRSKSPLEPALDLPASGATVKLAFVDLDAEPGPADWVNATWDLTGPWPPPAGDYWLATTLVGPAPGEVVLPDGWVEVWAQITLGVEVAEVGPISRLQVR